MRSKFWLFSLSLLGVLLYGISQVRSAEKQKAVRIGMMRTIFKDTPDSLLQILMKPFSSVMESQTGLSGDLVMSPSYDKLGKQLCDGEIQVGVFHGFEFAWAKLKYPDLEPLMLAVNNKAILKSYVVVADNSGIKSVDDLKGKSVSFARGNREHCRLFLEHRILPANTSSGKFFGKINLNADAEDAFDGLASGEVEVVLSDSAPWESFKLQKPGTAGKLRVVMISEEFIPAVIGYNPKKLDQNIRDSFKNGMLSASGNPKSKRMLEFVKISSFETIPEDFNEQMSQMLKSYPAP